MQFAQSGGERILSETSGLRLYIYCECNMMEVADHQEENLWKSLTKTSCTKLIIQLPRVATLLDLFQQLVFIVKIHVGK